MGVRHRIPVAGFAEIQSRDLRAALFHLEREESVRWSRIQDRFSPDIGVAEMRVDRGSMVPVAFARPIARNLNGLVEIAVFEPLAHRAHSIRAHAVVVALHRPDGTEDRSPRFVAMNDRWRGMPTIMAARHRK